MDTKNDDKNIKMLKYELWTTRINIEAEVIVFRENQLVEETILLEGIWKNNTREQKIQKKLEKEDGLVWENNGVVYMERRIYILNN